MRSPLLYCTQQPRISSPVPRLKVPVLSLGSAWRTLHWFTSVGFFRLPLIHWLLPGSNSVKGGYCTLRPAKLLICWILLKPLLRSFATTQSQTLRRECTGRQTEQEGQFSQRLRASGLWCLDCGCRYLHRGFLRRRAEPHSFLRISPKTRDTRRG